MSATLDYDLKKCMPHLSKDYRWGVLTVLILFANIRNRSYPSMQTLADMATGGNLHKATKAKKWLEHHGAFELVPYGKRVDDEKLRGKRQHIYQLTGVLKGCGQPDCDCWKSGEFKYLYFGKVEAQPDIVPVNNIAEDEIVTPNNIQSPDIVPIEIINGYKGSIPNTTKPKKEKKDSPNESRAPVDDLLDWLAKKDPMRQYIRADLEQLMQFYSPEWIRDAFAIAYEKPNVKNPTGYVVNTCKGWMVTGKPENSPPTASAPPSPANGTKAETFIEKTQREHREQYEARKKAG